MIFVGATLAFVGPPALPLAIAGPPPMAGGRPDPRMMSGLPRLDPQVPPGSLTVRCLLGTFEQPAVGVTVKLELRSADGSKVEERTAVSEAEGRATFTGLEGFFGGSAVASVDYDGELVGSQAISVDARAGSRVMLVKGASSVGASGPAATPPAATPPAANHGAGQVPMPGEAFASARFERGSLVVGTLDLSAGKPLQGVEVVLRGARQDGQPVVMRGVSDDEGRTHFTGLLADEELTGTRWVAEAALGEEGPTKSKPFTMHAEQGMAVILAVGGRVDPAAGVAPPRQRRPIMPPSRVPSEAPGTVRVTVIDADDKPVAELPVRVRRESVTGAKEIVEVDSQSSGIARVEVELSDDSLYQAEVMYGGAPFRSVFFRMDERAGVALELRVFETTSDPSVVQGEAQLVFEAREKNLVQVVQFLNVFVTGDKAYWPGGDFKIEGAAGAKGFVVMNRASDILAHDDEAPFATLDGPIPPGELVELSVAYLVEHDGAAELDWVAPFKLLALSVAMEPELTLTRGQIGPPQRTEDDGRRPVADIYKLGAREAGGHVELQVSGLPTNELAALLRFIGVLSGSLLALLILLLALLGNRRGARARLTQRRDALIQALEAVEAEGAVQIPGVERGGAAQRPGAELRRRLIIAALDQVYRELDALGGAGIPTDQSDGARAG
ncbi:MAG: hypothetical protein KC468_12375 [Myxococcales bacterium]|nr:hypothetical protein [Myxococcales bacterium]